MTTNSLTDNIIITYYYSAVQSENFEST